MQPSSSNYPVGRDENGNIRVHVVGNSGTGKTTIADELGKILCIPVMHLDEVFWKPNWGQTPDEEFREGVESFMRENESWVIDGNYKRVVGDLTMSSATTIVWLDPPFALYFTRMVVRTFLRLFRLRAPCSPGCEERLSDMLSWGEKSILWWTWTTHDRQREYCEKKSEGDNRWIRLGGWGSEVADWLEDVRGKRE